MRVLAGLVLLGAFALILLTRTQVGRDTVVAQAVSYFNRTYAGHLDIGPVTGTLVRDLYAQDVRLLAPDGETIIAVDTVILKPSWRALFSNTFRAREVVLVGPRITLRQDSAGAWNVTEALRKRSPDPDPGRPFGLDVADLTIRSGELSVARDGPVPDAVAEGRVFDYGSVQVADLEAALALDLREGMQQVGIERLAFSLLGQNVSVEDVAGRLTRVGGDLEVEDLRLRTTRSTVEGNFRLTGRELGTPTVSASLRPSQIAAADVQAFFPSLPIGDRLAVRGQIEGPLHNLSVEDLRVRRGETQAQIAGRVQGLPDSLAFDLEVPLLTMQSRDLRAVLPTTAFPLVLDRLGSSTAEGTIRGTLRNGVRLDADLDATTEAGSISGSFAVNHNPGRPLRYRVDASTQDLDPGRLTGDPQYDGSLSGDITIDRSASRDTLGLPGTAFRVRLGPSTFAGRQADSLSAEGVWRASTLSTRLRLRQGESFVDGTFRGDLSTRSLAFTGSLNRFDLRRLLPDAPITRVNGPLRLDLSAPTLRALTVDAEATLSSSAITHEGTLFDLPAGPVRIQITPPDGVGPLLALTTPFATATVDGEVDAEAVLALVPYWGTALVHAGKTAYAKPLRGEITPSPPPAPPLLVRQPLPFDLLLVVSDPDGLRAFVPSLPALAAGTQVAGQGRLGSESVRLDFQAAAPKFGVGSTALQGIEAQGSLSWTRTGTVLGLPRLAITGRADSLQIGSQSMKAVQVAATLDDASIDWTILAHRHDGAGDIDGAGRLDLLPDRNRLTLTRMAVDAGGFEWATTGTQVIDLYAEAAIVREFILRRIGAETEQRVAVRGVFSEAPTDTLYAEIDGFELGEIARSADKSWREAYPGGRIDARLAATQLLSTPQITGRVSIPRLTFDDRLLGRLHLQSQFIPGSDAVAVDLRLDRPGSEEPIPYDLTLEQNDLTVRGQLRLPGRTQDGTRDPGLLDLDLDLERADLFIFDYLFPSLVTDASGYATGTGRISGTFSEPLFEGDMTAPTLSASIPTYGLSFEGSGKVHVDQEGIHVDWGRLSDRTGGTALVSGSLLFNNYRFFSLDFSADLDEVQVIDVPDGSSGLPFYGSIRASGNASISGPLDRVFLRSTNAVTTPDSEIFIPIAADAVEADRGFLVYADADGSIPEFSQRTSVVGPKPEGERSFSEGLEMNLNVTAPPGSTVHLVFDPLIGDVIDARGRASMQLTIRDGLFQTFGTFAVTGGDYTFVAGEVFTRRFEIEPGGTLVWDGDPLDASINLTADFRTRASLAGLGLGALDNQRVPLVIRTQVGGRLTGPLVALSLDLDTDARGGSDAAVEALRPLLNDADRQALYATSVLLTGTFLLAPVENAASGGDVLTDAADELLFTSLSQLVSNRLNLFLSQALASDNIEVLLGLQPGEQLQDFDLTYGVALRFLDERLVIRGEGVYQQLENQPSGAGLQGEVAVEVKLSTRVALEVFYRRESELLGGTSVGITPYGSYGAGLRYETSFTSWQSVLRRVLGQDGSATRGYAPSERTGVNPGR